MTVTSTLDRYRNQQYRYSGHHHNLVGTALPGTNTGTLPLSIPKSDNGFTFEPTYHHSHPHVTTSNESSNSLSMASSSSHRINTFRNSDDVLLQPSMYIEQSGTFPRKREAQRIRIPSNQSVTSRSSTEKFEMRNSPMPCVQINVTVSE